MSRLISSASSRVWRCFGLTLVLFCFSASFAEVIRCYTAFLLNAFPSLSQLLLSACSCFSLWMVENTPSQGEKKGVVGTEDTMLVNFSGTLNSLLNRRTVKVPSAPQWQPRMKADLASAISGGQWSQTRRAAVPRWGVTDLRCQLCLAAPGTLEHRHECVCTKPPEGWPCSPPSAGLAIGRVGPKRANVLQTRGLLVMRLPSPPPPTEGWFRWLVAPSSDCDEQHIWYLDGLCRMVAGLSTGQLALD